MRKFYADFGNKIYQVKGNCDFSILPRQEIIEQEGHKILLTHGDLYGVKSGLIKLAQYAKSINADIVLYGHTHISAINEIDKVTLINPGTCSGHSYSEPSFCYLVINKDKVVPTLNSKIFSL